MLIQDEKIALVERAAYEELLMDGDDTLIASESWVQTVCPGVANPYRNRIYRSILDDLEADARIAATVEHYRSLGLPFQWIVSPRSRPTDLPDRLMAAGLRLTHTVSGMLFDLRASVAVEGAPSVTVARVDRSNLDEWIHVQEAGWGLSGASVDHLRAQSERRLASPKAWWVALVAHVHDAPVGALAISLGEGYAQASNAVVLPEHRHRGAFHALIAGAMHFARKRGITCAVMHAIKSTSAPILQTIGCKAVCDFHYYSHP